MFDLNGRTALVTGASGGIGGQIARALRAAGASIAISGTRRDALDALALALDGRPPILACDLGDPQAVDRLVAAAEDALGQVDILVNNAGLAVDGLAIRMKDDDWARVIEVNLTAAFKLSRNVLRGMMKRRWGRIINITSIVGVTGNPGQTNYAASKAGMIGLTKSLAAEVASRGITVNCIAPGFIETAMTNVLDGARRERLLESIPMGRLGQPVDVASGAVYLASDEAGYVTGQTLHINGGMAML